MKEKVPEILSALRAMKPDEIGKLDLNALSFSGRIIDDRKVSDHHAIIPTGKRPGELSPAMSKVFDAVVTRLIAAFYPACVKEVTTVSGLSNGVPFRARGVRVLDPGGPRCIRGLGTTRRRTSRSSRSSRPARAGPTSRP